jgi:hypothetical protein
MVATAIRLRSAPMDTTATPPTPVRLMVTTVHRGLAVASSLAPARGSGVVMAMAMDTVACTAIVADMAQAIAVGTATGAVMAMAADTVEATAAAIAAAQ